MEGSPWGFRREWRGVPGDYEGNEGKSLGIYKGVIESRTGSSTVVNGRTRSYTTWFSYKLLVRPPPTFKLPSIVSFVVDNNLK